jgi:hypothetical protein
MKPRYMKAQYPESTYYVLVAFYQYNPKDNTTKHLKHYIDPSFIKMTNEVSLGLTLKELQKDFEKSEPKKIGRL